MKFLHIGLLTPSLEDSMEEYNAFPGGEKLDWTIKEVSYPDEAILTGKGGHMRIASTKIANVTYELIQPLDPTSYHGTELEKKGPGLHHIAFSCPDNQEEVLSSIIEKGGKIVWEAERDRKHPIYVESADSSQVWELINI